MTELTELLSAEPVLARVYRARAEDRKLTVSHLTDGSVVSGTVEGVSEDGAIALIVGGDDVYEIDVEKVAVIQTRRSQVAKGQS